MTVYFASDVAIAVDASVFAFTVFVIVVFPHQGWADTALSMLF